MKCAAHAARARTSTCRVWMPSGSLVALLAACTPAQPSAAGAASDARDPLPATAASPEASLVAPRGPTRWTGTYKSTVGSFQVPDGGEWSGYKWRGEDAGEGLGEGAIALDIDTQANLVSGSADGAIGDVILTGAVDSGRVTATIRRKTPTDRGLTGTMVGTQTEGGIAGTMRLSFGDAHILREATFRVTPATAP